MSSDEFYNEGEYKTITARQLEVEYRNSAREECKSGWGNYKPRLTAPNKGHKPANDWLRIRSNPRLR